MHVKLYVFIDAGPFVFSIVLLQDCCDRIDVMLCRSRHKFLSLQVHRLSACKDFLSFCLCAYVSTQTYVNILLHMKIKCIQPHLACPLQWVRCCVCILQKVICLHTCQRRASLHDMYNKL